MQSTIFINPNWMAYGALLVWPLVAFMLYRMLTAVQATIWTILGAQMLLPVGTVIKFPMIPQFDKFTIPSLCALVGCIAVGGKTFNSFRRVGIVTVLVCANVLAPLFSVYENSTPINVGGNVILPAADLYNSGSATLSSLLALIPFLLGRRFFYRSEDIREIFRAFVIAGVLYSFLVLLEIRLSPQLHVWVYGYFPTDYVQVLRGDGYRPVVFMGHGLILSFFLMMCATAATILWSINGKGGIVKFAPGLSLYLGLVLILCKSFGATLYYIVMFPLVRWASPRSQIVVAVALVSFALLYPIMRSQDLIPTELLLQSAGEISANRALSLKVRFDNEDTLLKRASERTLFGWGGFGRNRVYGEEDGRDHSLTDGRWIVTMGNYGLIGFVTEFGLLAMGVFGAAFALKFTKTRDERVLMAGLALLLGINIIELIPNSSLMPWTWFLAGVLLAKTEALRSARMATFRANRMVMDPQRRSEAA
jgi:hypothetical protein